MLQHSLQGQDCRAWLVPVERACNIDTPFDLFLAEQILRQNISADAKHPGYRVAGV